MTNIILSIVSQRTDQDIALGIEPPIDSIDYLPFGTRSLKMAVRGDFRGEVIVRPEPFETDPERIASYAAESRAIKFSWGGGWERGVELENKPGTTKYIFFNVTHRGDEAAEFYTTTIFAFDEDMEELGRLEVTLNRPENLPETLLTAEWQVEDTESDLVIENKTPATVAQVPLYMARWWPPEKVTYAPVDVAGPPPKITLNCLRNVGDGFSIVHIMAENEGDPQPRMLARVDGDIQFPLVDGRQITADLYFMAGHWALRLWFFWLDKGVARRPQTRGRTVEERRAIERWSLDQEIPDAERLDLVFNKELNLVYLCTDLHWHEMWAPYENRGEVLQASISATKKLEVLIRGAAGVKIIARSEAEKRLPDPDRVVIPSDIVQERLRNPHQVQAEGDITHKHTPFFHDVEFDAELTSSDVLKG